MLRVICSVTWPPDFAKMVYRHKQWRSPLFLNTNKDNNMQQNFERSDNLTLSPNTINQFAVFADGGGYTSSYDQVSFQNLPLEEHGDQSYDVKPSQELLIRQKSSSTAFILPPRTAALGKVSKANIDRGYVTHNDYMIRSAKLYKCIPGTNSVLKVTISRDDYPHFFNQQGRITSSSSFFFRQCCWWELGIDFAPEYGQLTPDLPNEKVVIDSTPTFYYWEYILVDHWFNESLHQSEAFIVAKYQEDTEFWNKIYKEKMIGQQFSLHVYLLSFLQAHQVTFKLILRQENSMKFLGIFGEIYECTGYRLENLR